jgi:hypothetical protein
MRTTLNVRCKIPALLLTAALTCTPIHAMSIFGPKVVEGMVIDSKTGKPMEGAFVLAVYNESGGTLFGHSSSWCVRTKAVWTGPDGRFTFPKGKPNNPYLYAVKEGYVLNSYLEPSPRKEGEKPAEFRYLHLERHGESKIKSSQFIICERPVTRQDVEANITYLKLLSRESEHIPKGDLRRNVIESTLAEFEALPDAPPR